MIFPAHPPVLGLPPHPPHVLCSRFWKRKFESGADAWLPPSPPHVLCSRYGKRKFDGGADDAWLPPPPPHVLCSRYGKRKFEGGADNAGGQTVLCWAPSVVGGSVGGAPF